MEAANRLQPSLLKRIFVHTARLPLIYILVGFGLIAFSYSSDYLPLDEWRKYIIYSAKLGNILLSFAIATFIYNLAKMLCIKFEKDLAQNHAIAALILSGIRKGLRIIFFLVMLNLTIICIDPSKFYVQLANRIINTTIISAIGWIVIQILYTCEAVYYQRMMTANIKEPGQSKALYTKLHIIRNILTVIIVVITISAILMSFSSVRNIGISLLASAGFLTALVGLAAQKPLYSLATGLQIALSQPVKIGDVVEIENTTGTIEEIAFTCISLRLDDNSRVIIPINYFIEKSFKNWSAEDGSFKNTFTLHVDYLLPISVLREAFQSILAESKYWDKNTSSLTVGKSTPSSIEINMQVSANSLANLTNLRAEILEKMLNFLREHFPDFAPAIRYTGRG